jgi:putative protein-disulfide isomerase
MRILYLYDALCGWCYGFSPVIVQLEQQYRNQFTFDVLSAGLVQGERVAPIQTMAAYLEQGIPTVESTTGVKFGQSFMEDILKEGSYVSDSLPPGIALTVFKSFDTQENPIHFAHEIQRSFYLMGRSLNEVDTYLQLAPEFGIDPAIFQQRFEQPEYREKTIQEYQMIQEWGVQGFPALLIEIEGTPYILANGYRSYDQVAPVLEEVLSEHARRN